MIKMAIFIDTGVIVAADSEKDSLHNQAAKILENIENGTYGNGIYISDYVFDEVLTLSFIRSGQMEKSKRLAKKLLGGKMLNWLYVNENTFRDAISRYLNQQTNLSFTDCTTIELMKQNDIEYIATFDAGFKKIAGIKIA